MGVAGSGKTTLAKGILRRIWAVYLDNNYIVDAFFPCTRTGTSYEKWRPHFYQVLYRIVRENLNIGNSVILDVPHIKEMRDPKWRRSIKLLAGSAKARLIVIRCHCSDSVLRSRLNSRGESRDRWKLTHWQEFLAMQPSLTRIPFPHLEIDTERSLSANVNAALRYIFHTDPGT
jgi:predicted kinase